MDSIKYLHADKAIVLVSGAARGADELGEQYADEQHWMIEIFKPDYDVPVRFRRRAPFIRNQKMAEASHVLCAFWDGDGKGTRHMIGCAMREGLELHIFRYKKQE